MLIEESKELINEQANQLMERVNNLNVELSDWAIADILTYVQNEMNIVCNVSNRYKFLVSYNTENKFIISIKIADVLHQKMLVHKKETTIPSYPPAEPIFLKTGEGVVFRECVARKQIKIENQKRSCWSIAPSRPRKYWSEDIFRLNFQALAKMLGTQEIPKNLVERMLIQNLKKFSHLLIGDGKVSCSYIKLKDDTPVNIEDPLLNQYINWEVFQRKFTNMCCFVLDFKTLDDEVKVFSKRSNAFIGVVYMSRSGYRKLTPMGKTIWNGIHSK